MQWTVSTSSFRVVESGPSRRFRNGLCAKSARGSVSVRPRAPAPAGPNFLGPADQDGVGGAGEGEDVLAPSAQARTLSAEEQEPSDGILPSYVLPASGASRVCE